MENKNTSKIETINLFEFAAKNKLRFPHRGQINVEDLFDLSIQELDKVYKTLNAVLKKEQEDSLLTVRSNESFDIEVQISIIKHIVTEKQKEIEDQKNAAAKRARRQRIMEIMDSKNDAELQNKTKEELQALLDAE